MPTEQTDLRVTSMVRKTLRDQPVLRIQGVWTQGEDNPITKALAEASASMQRQSLSLAGPPYWTCSEKASEQGTMRWEAGVPVDRMGSAEAEVQAALLPGGEVASIYYRGSFDRAGEVNLYLRGAIEAAGLKPEGDVRWIGLTDPAETPNPEDHYSELVWPLKD